MEDKGVTVHTLLPNGKENDQKTPNQVISAMLFLKLYANIARKQLKRNIRLTFWNKNIFMFRCSAQFNIIVL